jgi:hypothetical protein
MASILQKAQAQASYEAEAKIIGPVFATSLSRIAPASTTLSFYKYFQRSGSMIKKFFTHDIPSIFQKPRTPMKILILSLLFLIFIIFAIWFYNMVNSYKSEGFANMAPRNNEVQLMINTLTAGRGRASTEITSSKFFNIQPITFKQAAFLGPTNAGFFDANNGILNQLQVGSRFFFLQIDFIESSGLGSDYPTPYTPCLLYRDSKHNLTSKNSASISDVCKYISSYAFGDTIPNSTTPVVLFLHFARLPYATTDTDNYIKYLSNVSNALSEIKDYALKGGYYRASKENDLFNADFVSLGKSIIVGTNIDTSLFNKLTLTSPSDDLDYKINFHYYEVSTERVDVTEVVPLNNIFNALIFNASTLLKADLKTWARYKNYFIIAKVSPDTNLTYDEMNTLLKTYGINVITYDYFANDVSSSKKVLNLYDNPFSIKPFILQA